MSNFFQKQKQVNLLYDKEQEYYINFKITIKEYKAPNGFNWYSKAETDAKLMFFLKEMLESKHKAEDELEFIKDERKRDVAFGSILGYNLILESFERIFGGKE